MSFQNFHFIISYIPDKLDTVEFDFFFESPEQLDCWKDSSVIKLGYFNITKFVEENFVDTKVTMINNFLEIFNLTQFNQDRNN